MSKNTGIKYYKAEFLNIDEVNNMLRDLIVIYPGIIEDMQKVMDGVYGYQDLLDENFTKIRKYVEGTGKLKLETNNLINKLIAEYGEAFAVYDNLVVNDKIRIDMPKSFTRDCEKRRRFIETVIRSNVNSMIAHDIKMRVWDMHMGTEADGEKLN
ncbi:hypothetical protein E2A64_04780 [Pseudohoeflea suaedae]|uniref:Uncharacterized protein n=1 Tax=Pseudohoeflea suaedae TaxID=877384 RepID=A0A4R5PN19_9HYPH|nr:hypothetical protein [Pseudohoeflea suaedae]TDH38432.1 hypothetical protein E2A64_04780 [Pseudohoeflea suaedae]